MALRWAFGFIRGRGAPSAHEPCRNGPVRRGQGSRWTPVAIPPGIQADQRIRMNGKGIPRVNSYGYGDHYIHIKVKVPKRLTDRQRALMLSYAENETDIEGTVNGIASTTTGKCSTGN